MPTTLAPPEIAAKPRQRPGGDGTDGHGGGGDDSNRWQGRPDWNRSGTCRLAMWLGLASISMMFVAFSSAYIVRQGGAQDWQPITVPGFLLPNTLILVASSVSLELARRARRRSAGAFKMWITATMLLGITFLTGQWSIWRSLSAQGIYLSGSPHSSFFYLLTGAHGLHLLGGVLAVLVLAARAWTQADFANRGKLALDLTALYWHFMDGLWIYLFFLLFLWR